MPSKVIRWFDYNIERGELRVVFQSGKRYIYQGVPEETYREMKAAFSKGVYFNAHIRDQFPFVEIEQDD